MARFVNFIKKLEENHTMTWFAKKMVVILHLKCFIKAMNYSVLYHYIKWRS